MVDLVEALSNAQCYRMQAPCAWPRPRRAGALSVVSLQTTKRVATGSTAPGVMIWSRSAGGSTSAQEAMVAARVSRKTRAKRAAAISNEIASQP